MPAPALPGPAFCLHCPGGKPPTLEQVVSLTEARSESRGSSLLWSILVAPGDLPEGSGSLGDQLLSLIPPIYLPVPRTPQGPKAPSNLCDALPVSDSGH